MPPWRVKQPQSPAPRLITSPRTAKTSKQTKAAGPALLMTSRYASPFRRVPLRHVDGARHAVHISHEWPGLSCHADAESRADLAGAFEPADRFRSG